MASRRQAWVLLLAACDAGTDPLAGLEDPTPVGDNLRFHTDDSSDVCAGTLGYMQEYVRELIAVHGASPDHVVDYYWYPDDPDRVHDLCSSEGCTFSPGTVVSPSLPHEHELVHAVHGATGRAALFFEEGSAELFGSPEEREYDLRISVSDALEVSADPDSFHTGYYGVAGRFSAFLSREYGRDAFVSLLARTTYVDTVAEVDLALRAEFGRGLEDLAAEYERAEWTCRRSWYRDDVVACEIAPEIDCTGVDASGVATFLFNPSCDSEQMVGSRGGVLRSEVAFSTSESRDVRVRLDASDGRLMTYRLRACEAGCEPAPTYMGDLLSNYDFFMTLPAGRFVLGFEIPDDGDAPSQIALTLENVCPT